MLRMFCNGFQVFFMYFCMCFRCMFQSVSSVFGRILQLLHLDVSKVDWVLHLLPRFLLPSSASPPPPDVDWASTAPSLSFSMLMTFRRRGPHVGAQNRVRNGYRRECLDILPLASSIAVAAPNRHGDYGPSKFHQTCYGPCTTAVCFPRVNENRAALCSSLSLPRN